MNLSYKDHFHPNRLTKDSTKQINLKKNEEQEINTHNYAVQ